MKKDKFYSRFQLIYFVFLAGWGMFFPYFNVYLEQSLGFSGREIGAVIFVSLFVSVLVSPIWGILGDRTGKYRLVLQGLTLIYAVAAFLLFQMEVFLMVVIFTTLLEALGIGIIPMVDVLTVDYCEKLGLDFGRIRLAGSFGWVIGNVLVATLVSHLMFDLGAVMFLFHIGLTFVAFLIAFFLPEVGGDLNVDDADLSVSEVDESQNHGHVKALFANPAFVFLMIFNLLTFSLLDGTMAYAGNHLVMTLGAAESAVGWLQVVSALPEIVFFLVATKLMKKIGFKKFYVVSLLSVIARFVVYSFTESVVLFLGISVLSPLMVSVAVIGNVLYLKKHVSKHLIGSAFMINTAVLTMGRAVFSYIFGELYDHVSSFAIFRVSIIFFVIALVLALRTKHFDVLSDESMDI